ncbi:substrate-binding domain-containing protein [Actinokineospora iranica]|uniref:Ca-activated chloride channel family protein n=1 Tax=Actinokineospora iranica TaxID=1271860 RepID=A0A1G6RBS4_9PSEU|nr:substrate-binding domain-containing protein [Actinokineospora iranica]SDD01754.1 Ca-activated chloride channel family protein [Actinokineospora iranica]
MTPSRRRALSLTAAAVVALLVIVLIRQCAPTDADVGGHVATSSDCVEFLVYSSDEKAPILAALAEDAATSGRGIGDGRCVRPRVQVRQTSDVVRLLRRGADQRWDEAVDGPRPDVFAPSSSVWLQRLRYDRANGVANAIQVPQDVPSVTSTPLVIAMPEPVADALGVANGGLGWKDLLALVRDPRGWAARGKPDWGRFTLGKTNPRESTTGLNATISLVSAVLNGAPLTAETLLDSRVQDDVAAMETAAVHYGETSSAFVNNLYEADRRGDASGYINAVVLEEFVVRRYNQGHLVGSGDPRTPPTTKLVPVLPEEGTTLHDNPYLVLPWADPAKQEAARVFLDYVTEPAQQQRFIDAGFRAAQDREGYRPVPTPEEPAMQAVRDLWEKVRKRANVLFVVDVSGSMREPVSAENTRMSLAKSAAKRISDPALLADDDQVGLWEFSGARPGESTPWRPLVPVGPVGQRRPALTAAVDAMAPDGSTGLYVTVRDAVESLRAGYDPSRINAVVVLSDGANEYRESSYALEQLLTDVAPASGRPTIPVFAVAYSASSDKSVLERVATASTGAVYDSTDPTAITQVVESVLSNF